KIIKIDASAALALPGVYLVLTAADLGEVLEPSPLLVPHAALAQPRTQLPLALEEVRYAGEAVAMVVAQSRYLAEDALDLIDVTYEPLPVVHSLNVAAQAGAPLVHADVPGNIAAHFTQQVGDPAAIFASAPHVLRESLLIDRGAAMPMECRGIVAQWDALEER